MNNLAKTIHPATGNASLVNVVRHLRGSLNCTSHEWSPLQREAAEQAVAEAEELLGVNHSTMRYEAPPNVPVPHLKLVDPRPLYQREFPAFPIITEAIPKGFIDSSWHNNSSPSFTHTYPDGSSLHIHIDWPNPEDREAGPDSHRYTMWLQDANGDQVAECVYSNDWPQIVEGIGLFPAIKA